jgi:hypothetical protein
MIMGSSGITVSLTILRKRPASKTVLKEAIQNFLRQTWNRALPMASAKAAWNWIGLGDDSLLTLFDTSEEDAESQDEPAGDLTFWFYETVDWPQTLAEHWLALALSEQRPSFERLLEDFGYGVKANAVYPKNKRRFVVDRQRIGYPDERGIFWQLPDHGYEENQALSAPLRERAKQVREGAACECPYCRYLASATTPSSAIE